MCRAARSTGSCHVPSHGRRTRLQANAFAHSHGIAIRRRVPHAFAKAQTLPRTVFCQGKKLVGRGGLEPPTSRLSGVRSNHLSYRPTCRPGSARRKGPVDPFEACAEGASREVARRRPPRPMPRAQARGCATPAAMARAGRQRRKMAQRPPSRPVPTGHAARSCDARTVGAGHGCTAIRHRVPHALAKLQALSRTGFCKGKNLLEGI